MAVELEERPEAEDEEALGDDRGGSGGGCSRRPRNPEALLRASGCARASPPGALVGLPVHGRP
eukprot:6719201-Alexandrium_andersonii.AAC.1